MIVGAVLKRSKPEVYAQIGERTPTEQADHIA